MSRALISLASIYVVRMLGLFMVLPVIAVALESYQGATPTLIGLALGIYGATQGILQFPLAALSDRFGRKLVISVGLILFTLGSVVAAQADSVLGVILGRALQGAGAVAATIMALLADLMPEDKRARAMAAIGASIGVAFGLAMVVGPMIFSWAGLSGMFWVTTLLAILAIMILWLAVPTPSHQEKHLDVANDGMWQVVFMPELLRANIGVFALHASLMAIFLSLPGLLEKGEVISFDNLSSFYFVIIGSSFVVMLPLVILAEVKRKMRASVRVGAMVIFAALALLSFSQHPMALIAGVWLFFVGFNLCEAILPSLVSKLAPVGRRGAAMGGYSSSQFIGAFAGAAMGGVAVEFMGAQGAFIVALFFAGVWLFSLIWMAPVKYLKNDSVRVEYGDSDRVMQSLSKIEGVDMVTYEQASGRIYYKYDARLFDPISLNGRP